MEPKWITCGDCESPVIRNKFICKVKKAKIRICGLGFFEAYINGKRVSDDRYVPAWSDYEPRLGRRINYPIHDTFTHRVYYLEYILDSYIENGENTVEVILGNGWYNQHEKTAEGDLWYGRPKLWYEIISEGRTIAVSDERTVWKPSVIVRNNIYSGETHDFRLKDCDVWEAVSVCGAPKGKMCPQDCPPDKLIRVVTPKFIGSYGEVSVYDAGENISGYAVFTQNGNSGDETVVTYGESISGGRVDTSSTTFSSERNPEQRDIFISDGSENLCDIKFTWHGFRYFEIKGNAEDVKVYVIHSDVKLKCGFECENELLNKLFRAYVRSQLSNMHCGVPSDCPHRERLGYTGDGQLLSDTAMLLFDAEKFYKKWIRDILDCQDIYGGHIQHTAPFYGGGGGPGGWGSAVVMVPYFHFKHYGDISVIKEAYPHMVKWVGYMKSRSENGLVVREEEGGWCLGEWCTPGEVLIPESFVNTYYFAKALSYMKKIADILGEGSVWIDSEFSVCTAALKREFYNETENSYFGGVQGADAFALDLGIGNRDMAVRLSEKYEKLGRFDTGMFGTDILIGVLFENGFYDTAYNLLTAEGENTFGYLLSGATTLREDWEGAQSLNHPMFGAAVKHLFYHILGISFEGGKLTAKPHLPKKLGYAKGFLETRFGRIDVEI